MDSRTISQRTVQHLNAPQTLIFQLDSSTDMFFSARKCKMFRTLADVPWWSSHKLSCNNSNLLSRNSYDRFGKKSLNEIAKLQHRQLLWISCSLFAAMLFVHAQHFQTQTPPWLTNWICQTLLNYIWEAASCTSDLQHLLLVSLFYLALFVALSLMPYSPGFRGGVAACTGEPDDRVLSQLHNQWKKTRNRYVPFASEQIVKEWNLMSRDVTIMVIFKLSQYRWRPVILKAAHIRPKKHYFSPTKTWHEKKSTVLVYQNAGEVIFLLFKYRCVCQPTYRACWLSQLFALLL